MSHRQQVLRHAYFPQELDLPSRLSVLSDAFYAIRDKMEKAGKPVGRLNADYTGVCDLWTNLELANGEKATTGARDDTQVTTDPLTQLKLAAAYDVMEKDVANDLQREFNARVKKIVGHDLSPGEVKRLHALFTGFNPFQPK